jgi:glycerol-3-phosphate acyltransferase PlsX
MSLLYLGRYPMITIAVDCMGGDHGPQITLPACKQFLEQHADANLILVGLPQSLASFTHARARIVAASEVVTMDDPLEIALRRKKDSSMRVAVQQVKDGLAQAAVSAGNTAALMAISRYILKTMDGIERPAIAGSDSQCYRWCNHVCWISAPMSIARLSICCSLRSWARPWFPFCRTRNCQQSDCSTSGKKIIKGNETIKKAGELLRSAGKAGDLEFLWQCRRK